MPSNTFPKESPISSSIAIEFTSKSISACYNKKITEKTIEQALNLKGSQKSESVEDALESLELCDEFEKNLPAYWTIGIPDNASQNNRKSVVEAVKNYYYKMNAKALRKRSLADDRDDQTDCQEKKIKSGPFMRLINRSTAGAIAYMQCMRDEERLKIVDEDEDVNPTIPNRSFLVLFVDDTDVYGGAFMTRDGLVQQEKSYVFKNEENFENCDIKFSSKERMKFAPDIVGEITEAELLLKLNHVLKNENVERPIVFTREGKTCFITKDGAQIITDKIVTSPPDKFALFPFINGIEQKWENPERFILKGVNTKTRMLAGDADMIDYDIPGGFIGDATIECAKFKASLIVDGEKLPIKRTIFDAKKPLEITIDYGFYAAPYAEKLKSLVVEVDSNGIIQNFSQ